MTTDRGLTTSPTLLEDLRDPDNDAAWRIFLTLYKPLILANFRRLGLQSRDVEDVYDEVMEKLVRAMRGFVYDPSKRFRGWLKTLVKHEVYGFYRRRNSQPVTESLAGRDVEDEVGEILGSDLERLGWALQAAERVRGRTNEAHWKAFWRTVINEEEPRDVAADLGLSISNFYVARGRVLKALRLEGARDDRESGDAMGMEDLDELISRLRQIR